MKAPSMLIACGLVLCSTLVTRATTAEVPPATASRHAALVSTPPAFVEARFQILQLRRRGDPDADDPLFRPIDADDFRTNGDAASDFSNLRQNGLVRITSRYHQTSGSSIPRPTLCRMRRLWICGAWCRR